MQFIVQGYPAFAFTGGRPFDPALPAIVFIHGAALDHSVWQWQSRYFAHHGHGVLAVDLPAHGRSPGNARSRVEDYADWIASLLDAAGLERASLVGESLGSLVALDAAIRHRERVSRIALLGAALPMTVGEPFLAAAKDDDDAAFDMQSVWGLARNVQVARSAIPGTSLLGANRQLVARARRGVQHADLSACNAYAPPMDALRELRVPTLVISGRRDQMTPVKAGRALAQSIPGARLEVLDCGHAVMNEAPRETLAALRDFLPAA